MLNVFELEKILNGKAILADDNYNIIFTNISIDSRTIEDNSLFIAIKGDKFDGHDFITQLNSSCIALTEHYISSNITQILVPDTKLALQQLANYWRNQFDIPIIAVAGSNGKTTVKDMLASIFKQAVGSAYAATMGNFNNDIGLPLSILKIRKEHKLAVFEVGMNHPKETQLLAKILQPTIAIINNAQREHQEFMQNIENVAIEHGYLLEETSKLKNAILPFDSDYFSMWANQCANNNLYITSFGLSDKANISASNVNYDGKYTLNINYSNINHIQNIKLPCLGIHNITNSLAAAAASIACGIDINHIINGIENFTAAKGRLQKQIINNKIIINDTYNANPDSVKAAIDVLHNLPPKRLLILGDMGEVGEQGIFFHQEIGEYARQKGIERIYTLGNLVKYTNLGFYNSEEYYFSDIKDLHQAIKDNFNNFSSILIKGSRFMKMETIIEFIENLPKDK